MMKSIGVLVLALSFATVSFANDGGPCAADVQKFCADTQKGGERKRCLKAHEDQLSGACQSKMAKAAKKHGKKHKKQQGSDNSEG